MANAPYDQVEKCRALPLIRLPDMTCGTTTSSFVNIPACPHPGQPET